MSPLQAILDVEFAAAAGWAPADLAQAFLDGGARVLQLRAKKLPSGAFLDLADRLVRLASDYAAAIIINDRADLARMSGAAGVHVGQDDLEPQAVRQIVGPTAVVGLSTHSTGQVGAATGEPVSYIAVGPVFGTRTKDTGYGAVGLELVSAAAHRARGLPIVAIGGITLERAPAVIAAGAASVAVIADLLSTGDPEQRVRQYLESLGDQSRISKAGVVP